MLPWKVLDIDGGEYAIDLSTKFRENSWESWLASASGSNHIHKEWAATEADARAKMLIYLTENGISLIHASSPASNLSASTSGAVVSWISLRMSSKNTAGTEDSACKA